MSTMLPLDIASFAFDPNTQQPVLLLKIAGSPDPAERLVPIALGRPEAHAILSAAHGITFSRPSTHDLLVSVMQAAGLKLNRVEIGSFAHGTFLATLDFLRGTQHVTLDARPSDAITLALRTRAPLFIADNVYQETSVRTRIAGFEEMGGLGKTDIGSEIGAEASKQLIDEFHEFIQHVEPSDFE